MMDPPKKVLTFHINLSSMPYGLEFSTHCRHCRSATATAAVAAAAVKQTKVNLRPTQILTTIQNIKINAVLYE